MTSPANMAINPMKAERKASVGIAIMAKAPIAGLAKTRLIPRLGPAGAASLQAWLLRRTVVTALATDLGPVSLWCTPEIEHPEFAHCTSLGALTLKLQPDGDLGQRMHAAIADSPAPVGTLVIGTDCPLLSTELLRQAADVLHDHDAVLIPAEDGGYVLIGLRQPVWRVFEYVDWSSAQVMTQTRQRLAEAGLRWQELSPLWDIDHGADLDRLRLTFPGACP